MNKWKLRLQSLTPVQLIVSYYFMAVTVSVILLSLPVAHKPGVKWTFIDILFTAVSAVSVTGLATFSTVDTFSVPGIFILVFVLQFGGIGVMSLGTFVLVHYDPIQTSTTVYTALSSELDSKVS